MRARHHSEGVIVQLEKTTEFDQRGMFVGFAQLSDELLDQSGWWALGSSHYRAEGPRAV